MDDEQLQAASEAFGGVFVIVGHLTRLTDERLADWDLTTRQWLLLAVLTRDFPGHEPSLTEAAAAYGSSRQNVKQIAIGLERHGFLRMVPDAYDGRTTRLAVTDKVGIFDAPDGRARALDLLETAFEGLSRADVLALRGLVGRWLAAITNTPSTPRPHNEQKRPGKAARQ